MTRADSFAFDPEVNVGELLDPREMRELFRPFPWRVPLQIGGILVMYSGLSLIGFEVSSPLLWPLVWLLQGIILSGFLGAAHDCGHGTMFRSRPANRISGAIWAAMVLFNFSLYKHFHLKHHQATATPDDTEPGGEFPDLATYLAALPTHAFFIAFWRMSAEAARGRFPDFVPSKEARRHVRADNYVQLAWLIFIVGATAAWPIAVVTIYWVPLLIYFPMVFVTSVPEHYGCEWSENVWTNTRSIRSNALFRFVFWNGNYHAEHHLLPRIPSCNLHRAHLLLRGRIKHVETGYISFHAKLIRSLLRGEGKDVEVSIDPGYRINFEYVTYQAKD